jgi:hypothetical protein
MAVTPFSYGGNTILSHPIFVETILPFLLVFTIVFAVLEKSKILGDGKRQVDAIVALVVGLVVISFAQAVGIILQMTIFLAVALVVILVLMILLGAFAAEGKFTDMFPKALRYIAIVVVVVAVVIAAVYITGFWERLYDWVYIGSESNIFINILFFVIIAGAIVAVIVGTGAAKKS